MDSGRSSNDLPIRSFRDSGLFIELTQREHGEERAKTFVRSTVESLYKDIERDQASGVERTIIDYDSQRCLGRAPEAVEEGVMIDA